MNKILITLLLILPSISLADTKTNKADLALFVGTYKFFGATADDKCPGPVLNTEALANDTQKVLLLNGASKFATSGPYTGAYYFSDINKGEYSGVGGKYLTNTVLKNSALTKNVKHLLDGKIVVEEEYSLIVTDSLAILTYKLIYLEKSANILRPDTFACFYEK